jgi:hypothetical protein
MAGITKNFIVKNGLEVNGGLFIVNTDNNKVGVGTSVLTHDFNVRGGIGVTNAVVTGITTVNEFISTYSQLGIATASYYRVGTTTVFETTGGLVSLSGIQTIDATAKATLANRLFTGQVDIDNLSIIGVATFNNYSFVNKDIVVSGLTTTNYLWVSGVSTFIGITTNQSTIFANNLSVAGVSTFAGITTVTGETLFTKQLNVSGVGTIPILDGTTATYTTGNLGTLNATTGNIVTGVVTTLSGTNISYSGIATIGTLGVSAISTLGVTSTTNLTTQQLNVSGLSTFSGIATHTAGLFGTQASFTGVVTASSFSGSGTNLTGIVTSIVAGANITISGSTGQVTINSSGGGGTTSQWTTVSSGIVTTSNVGIKSTAPSSALDVIGDVKVSGIVTATDFNSTSDAKLKTNVQIIENPIEKIEKINGVSFNWIENQRPSMGVIADELQKVLPELVTDTDPKTVNYNGLIGLLIECVKSQEKRIEELEQFVTKITIDKKFVI